MAQERVCVAGYNEQRMCVRPDMPPSGIMENWLYNGDQVLIRPFAEVELDLEPKKTLTPPHTEDRRIVSERRVFLRMLDTHERQAFLQSMVDPSVEAIFGASIQRGESGWYVQLGEGTRSLGTLGPIQVERIDIRENDPKRWTTRLIFTDRKETQYRLNVTDLSFRYFVSYLRDVERMSSTSVKNHLTRSLGRSIVFLRIGLARGTWQKYPNRCHLQITGVYSFPDYLEGRCFADFAPDLGKS
jgi:hypothetical protein